MNPPPRRGRGLRRAAIVLGLLVFAVLGLLLALPLWFDARRISALLLDRAGTATGLDWRIEGEPQLHWRPQPRLSLPGLQARLPDGSSVLRTDRLELVLPWAGLREDRLRISSLRIEGARIEGRAFARWWSARPVAAPGPLPAIERLSIVDGEWQQDALRLHGLAIELTDVAPGQRLRLQAEGRITTGETAYAALPAPGPRFRLILDGELHDSPDRQAVLAINSRFDGEPPLPQGQWSGSLQFAPLWQADLQGELVGWPEAWPPLPAPLDPAHPIQLLIAQSGPNALDAPLQLQLRTAGAGAELRFVPRALLAWHTARERPQLPPLRMQAQGEVLEIDGLRLEGLRLELDDGMSAPMDDPAPP